jgi:hypothetical protein
MGWPVLGTCPTFPSVSGKDLRMLGVIAAVLFILAFILNAASASTPAILSPMSLMLAGLACLALHLIGVGTSWSLRR